MASSSNCQKQKKFAERVNFKIQRVVVDFSESHELGWHNAYFKEKALLLNQAGQGIRVEIIEIFENWVDALIDHEAIHNLLKEILSVCNDRNSTTHFIISILTSKRLKTPERSAEKKLIDDIKRILEIPIEANNSDDLKAIQIYIRMMQDFSYDSCPKAISYTVEFAKNSEVLPKLLDICVALLEQYDLFYKLGYDILVTLYEKNLQHMLPEKALNKISEKILDHIQKDSVHNLDVRKLWILITPYVKKSEEASMLFEECAAQIIESIEDNQLSILQSRDNSEKQKNREILFEACVKPIFMHRNIDVIDHLEKILIKHNIIDAYDMLIGLYNKLIVDRILDNQDPEITNQIIQLTQGMVTLHKKNKC